MHEQAMRLPNFTLKETLPLPFVSEKRPLIGLFLGHHVSRSSDKLVEWFWQQDPSFFIFAQLRA